MSGLPISVISRADAAGRSPGFSPTYVICHVIVNVTHHVIIDPEGSAGRVT